METDPMHDGLNGSFPLPRDMGIFAHPITLAPGAETDFLQSFFWQDTSPLRSALSESDDGIRQLTGPGRGGKRPGAGRKYNRGWIKSIEDYHAACAMRTKYEVHNWESLKMAVMQTFG